MKTVDEVIEILEKVVKHDYVWFDEKTALMKIDTLADTLNWLKGYQQHIELDKIRDQCEAENNPITWEELYSRNGLPVWIEDSFDNGEWYIIECFTASNRFVAHDRWGDTTLFNKKEMDDVWKAYRRER